MDDGSQHNAEVRRRAKTTSGYAGEYLDDGRLVVLLSGPGVSAGRAELTGYSDEPARLEVRAVRYSLAHLNRLAADVRARLKTGPDVDIATVGVDVPANRVAVSVSRHGSTEPATAEQVDRLVAQAARLWPGEPVHITAGAAGSVR